jgi:hypothetical protein
MRPRRSLEKGELECGELKDNVGKTIGTVYAGEIRAYDRGNAQAGRTVFLAETGDAIAAENNRRFGVPWCWPCGRNLVPAFEILKFKC